MHDPDKHIVFSIFSTDADTLSDIEQRLQLAIKRRGITADVQPVSCYLEIERQGLTACQPALVVNSYTVTAGAPVTDAMLDDYCARLAAWQRKTT